MKKLSIVIALLCVGGICIFLSFILFQKKDDMKYNNDIFTKQRYEALQKITYSSYEFDRSDKEKLKKVNRITYDIDINLVDKMIEATK